MAAHPTTGLAQTQALETVLCNHRRKDGQYCNWTAQPEDGYCWQHMDSLPDKVIALFKLIERSLLG